MTASNRNRRRASRSQKRRQTQQWIIIGMSVMGVLVIAAIIAITASNQNTASPQADAVSSRYVGLAQSISEMGATGFAIGAADAPVTIVEYSDFTCPHCLDLSEIIDQVIDDFVSDGDVRIVYKPVAIIHPEYAVPAAEAAICAGEQGQFWEMQDLLWSIHRDNSPAAFVPRVINPLADALHLDTNQFSACLKAAETAAILSATENEIRQVAQQAGMTSVGTPLVLLNGAVVGYTGADSYYGILTSAIESELGN